MALARADIPRALPVTKRQVDSVRAYVATGSIAGAAAALGVRPQTVKIHLAATRDRLDARTTSEAVYVLTRRGDLVVEGRE